MCFLLLLGLLFFSVNSQKRLLPLRHSVSVAQLRSLNVLKTLANSANETPVSSAVHNNVVLGLSFGTLALIAVTCVILVAIARFTARKKDRVFSPV